MNNKKMSDFAKNFKILRAQHQMSQADLARLLGVSRSAISSYENGSRNPDHETLVTIANCFHVSIDYLLGREGKSYSEYREVVEEINSILQTAPISAEKKHEIIKEVRDYFTWKIDQARKNPPKATKE